MTRYTITHADAARVNDWCIMTTFATVEAETPEDARAAFAAAHPDRAILELRAQDDPGDAFLRYGEGAWTDEERDAHREKMRALSEIRSREAAEIRERVSAHTVEELAAELEYTARRETETTPNQDGVHVGDIFFSSWGYEQTNIDFWQVVALRGKRTAQIRRVSEKREEGGDMTGYKRPIRDAVYGETYTVRTATSSYDHQPTMRDPSLESPHHIRPVEPGRLYGFSTYA